LRSQQLSDVTQAETLKLITFGRLTDLPHIVEVRFVFIDESYFVLAGKGRSDWILNAIKSGKVKVRTRDWVFETSATLASATEMKKTVAAFASKYGGRVLREWYSHPAACLRLDPQGQPMKRGAVRGEAEATTTYREWRSQNMGYYRGIADAFDSASEEYDFTIGRNYINTWIRKRSIKELLGCTRREDTLLEVGCGTGAEAVEISSSVSKIIATDISERMIDILRKKIQARKLSGRIVPLRVKAADISKASELVEDGKVDAVYSFNGALNCEPDLPRFVEELSSILVPGGFFVCSVRNSLCLGEALSHAVVFQFGKMAPRKKQPVMVSVGGMDIPAFYYPPIAFSEFFAKKFNLKKLIGLPAFLPPAYLSNYCVKFKSLTSVLEKLEWALGQYSPFNRLGDQSLFVFQMR
jgi:ubiquinone/menaquinone biosynthesis C-methylase UbiE